jgi:putative Mn2+ efflux pump MntP
MVLKLVALVVPLGLDTFAIAAALGLAGVPARARLRVSSIMVAFEAGMPLIGLAIGAPLGTLIGSAADYAAIVVLTAFGVRALLLDERPERERLGALSKGLGRSTIVLGLSISMDELAIGFTLGLLGVSIPLVIGLIALQALIASQLGLRVGSRLGDRLSGGAERLAGLALVLLAIGLLISRLAG